MYPIANPSKSFRNLRIELMESYDHDANFYVFNELEMCVYIQKHYNDPER